MKNRIALILFTLLLFSSCVKNDSRQKEDSFQIMLKGLKKSDEIELSGRSIYYQYEVSNLEVVNKSLYTYRSDTTDSGLLFFWNEETKEWQPVKNSLIHNNILDLQPFGSTNYSGKVWIYPDLPTANNTISLRIVIKGAFYEKTTGVMVKRVFTYQDVIFSPPKADNLIQVSLKDKTRVFSEVAKKWHSDAELVAITIRPLYATQKSSPSVVAVFQSLSDLKAEFVVFTDSQGEIRYEIITHAIETPFSPIEDTDWRQDVSEVLKTYLEKADILNDISGDNLLCSSLEFTKGSALQFNQPSAVWILTFSNCNNTSKELILNNETRVITSKLK